jgi:hypothetical protein
MGRSAWRRWAAFAAVLGCVSGTAGRPAHPMRPLSSGERSQGYQEAVDMSQAFVSRQGRTDAKFVSAEQVKTNIWRVRFGLAPEGSGRVFDVYFDGSRRTVIKSEEVSGVRGTVTDTSFLP